MGIRFSANIFLLAAAGALTGFSTLRAAPDPSASPAAVTSLEATEVDQLHAHVNEQVSVHGTPTSTGQSKSGGVCYLDFGHAHGGVSVVFFAKSSPAHGVSSENDLKKYVGKQVTVSGKLVDYKGDLQITVNGPDQIKVAE